MATAMDTAFATMCLAFVAVVLVEFLNQLPDSGTCTATPTTTHVPTTYASTQVLLPTATLALFAAVALLFRHLQHRAAAGGNNRRLSELLIFMLCASVSILQHVFFVQPAGDVVIDVRVRARELGAAAARMLPAAATVSFFLGVALVLDHVSAGDGPVVRILSKMALEAAALLVGLMSMALYTTY